ncbi:MAG: Ldh family oxidoreductase, partial [Dehalococcoidia bacterium]|nr:Ldh family oxidoreductase [Dehalococcoidia bacterium]
LDLSGAPTTDPAALAEGGALLPLGATVAHKGFGLALAVEALAALLGGSAPVGPDAAPDVGLFVLALDPGRFAGRAHLEAGMSALLAWVTQPPYREGVTEILTPGDRSRRYAAERALAIPVDERTWLELSAAARAVGVEPPSLEPRRRRHRGGNAEDADGSPDD